MIQTSVEHHISSERAKSPARLPASAWLPPFIVALAVRLVSVAVNEIDNGDWVTRTMRAADFVHGKAAIWAQSPWPEGNYLLPALPIAIGLDAYWSVRVVYALVASLAIPALGLLALEFGERATASLAMYVLALLPFHIYISSNGAMTEGPFLLLVILAMLQFSRWQRTGEWSVLIGCAVSIIGAESFRFDGVFVAASLCAVGGLGIVVERDSQRWSKLTAIATLGLLSLIYPVALLISWKLYYGDATYMIKLAQENTLQFFADGSIQRWPKWFYVSYTLAFWLAIGPAFAASPVGWALGWWGALRSRLWRSAVVWAPIAVLSLFYLKSALSLTLLNQVRYAGVLGIPLLALVPTDRIGTRLERLFIRAIPAGVLITAMITLDAAWHDRGVITRQLGTFAPVKPDQHASRFALGLIESQGTSESVVVFSPHVQSAWLALHEGGSTRQRIIRLNVYRTTNLVHTKATLADSIEQTLQTATLVVTSARQNTEGVQDGLVTEIVQPTPISADTLVWRSIRLSKLGTSSGLNVYRVLHSR